LNADLGDPTVLKLLEQLTTMPRWLVAPSEPATVRDALRRCVPELIDRTLTIDACDPMLRLKGKEWLATYEVTVRDPAGGARVLTLSGILSPPAHDSLPPGESHGPFGDPTWRGRLPELGLELSAQPSDDALPVLTSLVDPAAARALLEESLRASAYPGISIRACTPEVMRYHPGSRCTVRYRLEYAPGSETGPAMVVAKTYHGDKGKAAFAGMTALWSTELASGRLVRLAEPLAYVPALRLLVQGPIAEQETLKKLVRSSVFEPSPEKLDRLAREVDKVAEGLAALHASGVSLGESLSWEDELAEVREMLDRLSPALPGIVDAATPLFEVLQRLNEACPRDAGVPTHRSFRPAQILLNQGDIGFIDFDGLCTAEPACDVALFRASLRKAAAEAPSRTGLPAQMETASRLDVLDELCDRFLVRYQQVASVSPGRLLLWETVDLLTSVLHCWTKVKPRLLPIHVATLNRHLRTSGRT
jgi:hypothetical protein